MLCSALGVCGALILAINTWFSPFGWVLVTASAGFGIPWAARMRLRSMLAMQCVFFIIDAIGVYRHFLPTLELLSGS